jgi:hypothetical protein
VRSLESSYQAFRLHLQDVFIKKLVKQSKMSAIQKT